LFKDPLTQGTVGIIDEPIVEHLIGIGPRRKRPVSPNILKPGNERFLIRSARCPQGCQMCAVMIPI
jgi:hypothetical protein